MISKDWLRQRIHGTRTKNLLRRGYYLPNDALDLVLKRRDPLVPPKGKIFVGDQNDFVETGDEFFRYFTDLAQLTPDDDVLEVGSGIGRMARPLTTYLNKGTYEGLDIVPGGIRWCTRTITRRYPNFRFQLADVRNDAYNPRGSMLAKDYVFPYRDESFDFVFLTSVVTHMLPPDMNNYLDQVGRVLRDGGRCLLTFFLLNDESKSHLDGGRSSLDFNVALEGCRTIDGAAPERAIAYEEEDVRASFVDAGLTVREPIRYGSWCGRLVYLSYQDVVVADRAGTAGRS